MLTKEQNDLVTQTGPGTPMGDLFRCYWLPIAAERGAAGARLPAGARQAAVRAPDRLPRHRRHARPDRRVLRPSRRVAVVRPQRGVRPALPLSRLEVRRDRPVRRGALRAGRVRLRQEDQAEVLSADREGRRAVDLHGPAREASPPSRSRSSHVVPTEQSFTSKRLQECNWLQAMEGGIDSSHVSFLHRGDLNSRSAVQGRGRQQVQPQRPVAGVRSRRERGRALHRRAPQSPRTTSITGASRPG